MKSQKRSPSEKAFSKGYQAAIAGKSWDKCPHESGPARDTWMSGWREGREDKWNGFSPRAQAQKIINFY